MEQIRRDIEDIIRGISILRDTQDNVIAVSTKNIDGKEIKIDVGTDLNVFVEALGNDIIYTVFYKRLRTITVLNKDFTKEFRDKYTLFKAEPQSGWIVEKEPDLNGNVIIQKNNYDYKLSLAGAYLLNDYPIRKGIDIFPQWFSISQFKENKTVSPAKIPEKEDSYIYYSGNHLPDNYGDVSSNGRFYFNLNAEADDFDSKVLALTDFLLKNLNERYIPFLFKIVRFKEKFNRADSAVIYINNRHFYCVVDIIKKIYLEFGDILSEDTVMFADKIGKGIGFAEQPPFDKNDDLSFTEITSFGMHRSEVIAKIIVEVLKKKEPLTFEAIKQILNNQPKKSYGDGNNFHLNYTIKRYYSRYNLNKNFSNNSTEHDLKYAEKIAYKLYSEGFWDFLGRCSWISLQKDKSYQTLDTDFTEGLAGICLFLYYLSEITKKEIHNTFFAGAIKTLEYKIADRYKWSDKNGEKKTLRNGYFKGDLMAIYILRKFGINQCKYFKDTHFYKPQQIVDRILLPENKWGLWDGQSGTIVSLLKLHSLENDCCYKDKAIEIGENLLHINDINGLSYTLDGICGIILALLFLYKKTNECKYLEKANFILGKENQLKLNLTSSEKIRPFIQEILVDRLICRHICKDFLIDCNNEQYNNLMDLIKAKLFNTGFYFDTNNLFNFVNSELNQKLNGGTLDSTFLSLFYQRIDNDILRCDSKSLKELIGFRPNLFDGYAGVGYFLLKNEVPDKTFPSILFPFFKEGEYL